MMTTVPLKYSQTYYGISFAQAKNSSIKEFFKHKLDMLAKDKTVIDIGAGNGVLSFLAILAGAKKVYAVEKNKEICALLEAAVASVGWSGKIVVINDDFTNFELAKYYLEADICVGEIINGSIYNNVFPYEFTRIKQKYPHLHVIPEQFSYSCQIVSNDKLDWSIDPGYEHPLINQLIKSVCLPLLTVQPLKLASSIGANEDTALTDIAQLINYDFNNNIVVSNTIQLPELRDSKWLKIFWCLDGDQLFNKWWQTEYVPLSSLNDALHIGIEPDQCYHRIVKS